MVFFLEGGDNLFASRLLRRLLNWELDVKIASFLKKKKKKNSVHRNMRKILEMFWVKSKNMNN